MLLARRMHWIALQPLPEPAAGLAGARAPRLVDTHAAWAWWALQFTPLVARVEDTLVMEVSRSERLFGGRTDLLQRLLQGQGDTTVPVFAQGPTSLQALARLWAGMPDAVADALPLRALAAARPHLPTLERMGCTCWGQLRALPRGGLVRRFGAELVDAVDCAYGQRPELYPWLTLPDVFEARLELSAAVESAAALLFGARRLLAQLLVWLRARQHGVLALELLWDLDARRSNALHTDAHHDGSAQGRMAVRTAQATQDMQHLQRLMGEQLAQVSLPAPVLYLHLRTLQTQALDGGTHSLLPQDVRKGDSLHQMLERLRARLGPEQVLCVEPQARHSPEQMQVWSPWTPASQPPASAVHASRVVHTDALLWPAWLLKQPQALALERGCPQYHGPLVLLAGPQRVETGWLDGDIALRDYFVARSTHAGLVWVFRERLNPQALLQSDSTAGLRWYLHGVFG